jgi:O-antigen ligase
MNYQDKHQTIIQILTAFLFLNLNIYLPNSGVFPFPAYLIDILIFIFILLYYMKKNINLPINNIFFIWLIYFLSMNIIYFIFSPTGEEEFTLFKVIIFLIFLYVYMIFLFALDNENLTVTRKTLIFIAPIATLSLGIEYFNPGFFILDGTYEVIQGRAASFYRNANYAGTTMIIFLILGIDMIDKKYRTLFILIIFLGVFFTMSRSNLITFFIIIIILFLQKKLHTKHFILSTSVIVIFFIWLSSGGLDTLSQKFDIEITENMKNRVNFFVDNKLSNTSDMDERQKVLYDALEFFVDNPLFGEGFGATILWEHPVGPHNIFAMLWAEQGIFGFFLIPILFLLTTLNIFKYGNIEQKQLAILFIILFTLSGLFSHDMLSSVTIIAFITIVSTIGYKAKKRHYLKNNTEIKC